MSKTPLIKIERSNFPISDTIRAVAMMFVVLLTLLTIKIGGFFTDNKGGTQVIESPHLSETGLFVEEENEIIEKLPG